SPLSLPTLFRSLARAGETVDELRREIRARAAVASATVSGTLQEVQVRPGREAFEVLQVEHGGTLDHPMDEQFIAVGVDGRYAGVMPLEVEVRGRHNAVEVLERRERDALRAPDGNPPRPLERRALAELARRRSWNFGRIGREGKVA